MPVEVLAGRDGWLFMRGDSNRVLEQHTGELGAGPRVRERWRALLAERVERMRATGIPWVGHVAPDKEAVYAEMLPAGVEPAGRRPVHDFLAAAESAGAPVAYGLNTQLAGKPGGIVYYESDTHWNGRGAWLAAGAVCEALSGVGVAAEPLAESEIEWRRARVAGDLGSKLDPPRKGAAVLGRPRDHRAGLVSDNRIRNHGRLVRFARSDGHGPSAVLFGESFANPMLPFLKESFARLTFAHASVFDPSLIRRERPDAVIWLPVERFLLDLPSTDRGAALRLRLIRARKRFSGATTGPPGGPGSHFLEGIPRAEARQLRTG